MGRLLVTYDHGLTLPLLFLFLASTQFFLSKLWSQINPPSMILLLSWLFLHSCVPEWTMIGEHGPPHQKTFTWQLTLGEVRNILKWLFSKSLMLSFLVLNNWDWTKQEIGEECGGRAGCIDLRISWITLNISRWFIYFDLFQMILFTLNFSRWLTYF